MKINGSLVFDASSASKIQNLRVEAAASLPSFTAADDGRLYYNSASGILYVGVAATTNAWVALATGGNAAALQTEVDNLEASLGAMVDSLGVFQAAALEGSNISSPTSLTDAILQLDSAITGQDTLAELTDTNVTGVLNGDFLQYQGGTWVDHTLVFGDLSDVVGTTVTEINLLSGLTANATELNTLNGITALVGDLNRLTGFDAYLTSQAITISATEFSFLDGLTSNIQGQLDGLQTEDATLTALAGLNGTGIVVGDAVDSFVYRTLVAPAAGFTIGNADGVAGNPTFALANDLAALEGLTTTGYIVRTGDGTATTRSLAVVSGELVITGDASGTTTDTTFGLATVANSGTGSFVKISRDTFGRVTGTEAVAAADIQTLVDSVYVNVAGDTMDSAANLVFSGGGTVKGLPSPTLDTDAANKAYVDALTAGLSWKQAVRVASTGNIDLTTGGLLTVDGVTVADGDRVLVKDQSSAAENGIYVASSGSWTRATDMDAAAEFDGSAVFVQEGTTQQGTGWTETATVVTVDTDAVVFSQFTGGALYTWGVGLTNVGNTVNINVGAGIAELPSDEVGIDLYDSANSALILTSDGSTRVTTSPSQLYLLLAGAGGLDQDSTGLFIAASGVTNAMLANSAITINTDENDPDAVALGETLQIIGTSAQGITTNGPSDNVVQISALNASSSQKGVASFDATEFTVTAGNVVLGTVPVNKIASNSITFAGTTGSDAVVLGETFTFVDGGSAAQLPLVATAIGTNDVTITLRRATTADRGVASFNDQHFSVTDGAVSLNATLDDLTNVSGADAASAGDVLRFVGGTWTAATTAALAGDIALDDLSDVNTGIVAAGEVLMHNGSSWVAAKMYHLHEQGSASTSWSVAHNLGQKYCVVTVVDGSDEVVIPQSITFDDANNLTVTFNTAITGKVVVMGLNSASA